MKRKICSAVATKLLSMAVLLGALGTVVAEEQVIGLAVLHRAGQTFVTFKEVGPAAAQDTLTVKQFGQLRREWIEKDKVRYRVYCSQQPITSLEGIEPLAEMPPLTGWNAEYYGNPWSDKPALRYVIQEGKAPLPPGTGLFVHNPDKAGDAYYAVTAVIDGKENAALGPDNALRSAVKETVGQGAPVLQRIEKPDEWQYVRNPTLHYYVRWESPPNCSVEGKPIDYVLGVPPEPARPAGVGLHLHCWGGSLNGGYGWWYQAEQGHLLIAANQVPYDWWTGYHEKYWKNAWERAPRDKQSWQEGVVHPYSQTRMLSFLDWVATKWDVDLSRTHVAGNSMGGAGAPMFAIRHPDRIAWATGWVGVHIPEQSPQFKSSYSQVYGEPDWGVEFADGTPVWDHFNDAWYLRKHPDKDLGLICFSNGKNDGGIGWPQAAEFYWALQETRQAHIFVWGQAGHGQRAALPISLSDRSMPMDLRIDQSLPAFTGCSLDDDPGRGDPAVGDAQGQSNLYLFWQTDDVVDRPDRWEMTVALVDKAPKDECTVNITPRRLQQLKLEPGQKVQWTSTSLADGGQVQTGQATADEHGLVTLEKVRVGKAKSRVVVTR
jgi:pimeloyl-ACP methyl ester carboxylesterase